MQHFKVGDFPTRVPRGSACLNCRRRKMRCDGVKPVCGQCVHMEREYDCEYTDGPTPSPTQLLERKIAAVEARIRELEASQSTSSPGAGPSTSRRQPRARKSTAASAQSHLTPGAATPESAQPTSYMNTLWDDFSTAVQRSDRRDGDAIPTDPASDPHPAAIRLLVSMFVPYASQTGFFLHFPRFLDAVFSPDVADRHARLSPALLNTILLWGSHLSTNQSVRAYEPTLLTRSVKSLSDALPEVSSLQQNATQIIQAEVLLSNYFFCQNRRLEGTYHCSAAVSLVLSCKLNHIRGAGGISIEQVARGISSGFNLPPPADVVEEAERVNAFWSVYVLDRNWSVANGHLGNDVFGGVTIDLPWPVDVGLYEATAASLDELRIANTLQGFLNSPSPELTTGSNRVLTHRIQAAALLERATRHSAQWSAMLSDFDGFNTETLRLGNLTHLLIDSMPSLDAQNITANSEWPIQLLITHTIALTAAIRLYANTDAVDQSGTRRDVAAAMASVALVNKINLDEITYIDPIMATLWTTIGRVLLGE
ncbi:hypothetical protein K474DRAFT_1601567 [Panus rudis PR-1116 ss-1]|nr:hypothetical protein K474DRAFT_1601567 [Panus rudis PR-1116 ss-1]